MAKQQLLKIMIHTKEIPGYENYIITDVNTVFNVKRKKLIKVQVDKDGYLVVQLWKNSKPKKFKMHRLVAMAFIPNPENKPQVNHINGIKFDNSIENLEWVTQSENMLHAYKIGLQKPSDKQKESASNLHAKLVLNTQNGVYYKSIKEAAAFYGKYSEQNIGQKVLGKIKNNTPFILV